MNKYIVADILYTISIHGENRFELEINTKKDISPLIEYMLSKNVKTGHMFISALIAVTENLEISAKDKSWSFAKGIYIGTENKMQDMNAAIRLNFSIDKDVLKETNVEYDKLISSLYEIALVNKGIALLIRDTRDKYLNQRYFHCPQGIFSLFDSMLTESNPSPKFHISYDGVIGENQYQLGLAYAYLGYRYPEYVVSFGNDEKTILGGTHMKGIIEGIATACRKYIKAKGYTIYKVTQKKILSDLVIVCSVRGNNLVFEGATKQKLGNPEIKTDLKKLVSRLFGDVLNNNKEIADHILFKFRKK